MWFCNNVPFSAIPIQCHRTVSSVIGKKGNCLERLQQRELEFSIDSFFIMKSRSIQMENFFQPCSSFSSNAAYGKYSFFSFHRSLRCSHWCAHNVWEILLLINKVELCWSLTKLQSMAHTNEFSEFSSIEHSLSLCSFSRWFDLQPFPLLCAVWCMSIYCCWHSFENWKSNFLWKICSANWKHLKCRALWDITLMNLIKNRFYQQWNDFKCAVSSFQATQSPVRAN